MCKKYQSFQEARGKMEVIHSLVTEIQRFPIFQISSEWMEYSFTRLYMNLIVWRKVISFEIFQKILEKNSLGLDFSMK